MKKRLLSLTATLCCLALLFTFFAIHPSGAEYNDRNFRSYSNLSKNSDVPSLFKNGNIYAGYKNYPPVISDGIEYVPLELFYGLSNIKIKYSDDNSNFYIQNKKTNKYISFNIDDSYAVTGENKVYDAKIPTYYGVHYVPLRIVCDSVGLWCSTFNDGENLVYAIAISSSGASLSARELLEIHAPELYSKPEEPSGTEDPPVIPTPPPETQKPETPKTPEYKRGNVILLYTDTNFANAERTLDTLAKYRIKAVFAVTEKNILDYPSTVRRIYTSGHTLAISFDIPREELFSDGVLEEKMISAQNALYEVTKTKTRIAYLGEDSRKNTVSAEIAERVAILGMRRITANADSGTNTSDKKKASDSIRNNLKDIRKLCGSDTAVMKMYHTGGSVSAVGTLASVVSENPVIRILTFTETSKV